MCDQDCIKICPFSYILMIRAYTTDCTGAVLYSILDGLNCVVVVKARFLIGNGFYSTLSVHSDVGRHFGGFL
jgi:hypothetical protein